MAETRDFTPPDLLFIDIESSGLFQERLSIDDAQQPWAQSVAAMLCNSAGTITNAFIHTIKPDGRTAKEKAIAVHGITTRAGAQVGVPEARVLGLLGDMLKTAPLDRHMKVITYGDFDFRVLSSLFARFALSQNKPSSAYDRLWLRRPLVERINLMDPWCTQLCKIPSEQVEGTYRWPSLDEARMSILGKPSREGFHDAWDDMMDVKEIYFALASKGYFNSGSERASA